jgi:transposase
VESFKCRDLGSFGCRLTPHLGIDEKSFLKRHQNVSVVVDLDTARILHVADDRQAVSLAPFFHSLSEAQRSGITAIAVDMWEPYRKTLGAHVPEADQKTVFDKFHIMQNVNTAVDTVRKQEHRTLSAAGTSPLTRTKYAWLRNPAPSRRPRGGSLRPCAPVPCKRPRPGP